MNRNAHSEWKVLPLREAGVTLIDCDREWLMAPENP
jgi:hypothetical protein